MKVALLLIGVLVCASMTEASSVKWAKNHVRAHLKHHQASTTTAKAPVTTTTGIINSKKILVTKLPFLIARSVRDVTGCGDECDAYLLSSFLECSQTVGTDVDTDDFVKCQELSLIHI